MLVKILMSIDLFSAVRNRGGFRILTTDDGTVDLDGRPNNGITGSLTKYICQADDGDDRNAGCEMIVNEGP